LGLWEIWEGVLYFRVILHFYDTFLSLLRGYIGTPSSLSPHRPLCGSMCNLQIGKARQTGSKIKFDTSQIFNRIVFKHLAIRQFCSTVLNFRAYSCCWGLTSRETCRINSFLWDSRVSQIWWEILRFFGWPHPFITIFLNP
jgi:hypothetical protein